VAVDPNIPDGDIPNVEHDVALPGIEAVPVTRGAGLTPGDAISVEPNGIPVGGTVELVVMPRGVVVSMLGVGLTIALTCALAAVQTTSAGRNAAINATLVRTRSFAMRSLGGLLSDIGQAPLCVGSAAACKKDTHGAARFAAAVSVLLAARWTARPACSIKYAFIVLAPMRSHLDANPVA
jgi:hypothetical protein